MVSWGEALGRRLASESRALTNGISAFIKGTPESSPTLFHPWRQEDSPLWTRKNCSHPIMLAPWPHLQPGRTVRNKCSVVYKPPCLWYFIVAVWIYHDSIEKKKQIIRWRFCTYIKLCMCVYEKWIKCSSKIWCELLCENFWPTASQALSVMLTV